MMEIDCCLWGKIKKLNERLIMWTNSGGQILKKFVGLRPQTSSYSKMMAMIIKRQIAQKDVS